MNTQHVGDIYILSIRHSESWIDIVSVHQVHPMKISPRLQVFITRAEEDFVPFLKVSSGTQVLEFSYRSLF
jgi:hypothetical protein